MGHTIKRGSVVGAAAFLTLAIAGGASGAVIPLQNASFENLTGSDPAHFVAGALISGHRSATANPLSDAAVYVTPTPAPGWTMDPSPSGSAGTMNPTAAYMPVGAEDGLLVGYSAGGILYQIPVSSVVASTPYQLTLEAGRPLLVSLVAVPYSYHVWLSSGTTVLSEVIGGAGQAAGTWAPVTITWTAPANVPANMPLQVNLSAQGVPGLGTGPVLFDSVGMSVVPEPAELALLAGLPLIWRRRRA